MHWIYLSPHLDDTALSCGGLVWEQVRAGQRVSIWTICAGDPPAAGLSSFAEGLHLRWETNSRAVVARRAEDISACGVLGADYAHFDYPDCIYRRSPRTGEPLYASEESLFGGLHPDELDLVHNLAGKLEDCLPAEAVLVCPLSIGGHVDHRLTRWAAECLDYTRCYYAEYPYVDTHPQQVQKLIKQRWKAEIRQVSSAGMEAWMQSVAAYRSQISTFWSGEEAMRAGLQAFSEREGGVRLWYPPA